jgi:hypothetical protein
VAVGVVLLVVAAGVVYALWSAPSGATVQSTRLFSIQLASNGNETAYLWGSNGSAHGFQLAWHSDQPVAGTLAASTGCHGSPPTCELGARLAHWDANRSGSWSTAGDPAFPLLLVFDDPGASPALVQVSQIGSSSGGPAYSSLAYISFLAAGAAVGAIGGLSLFLGLFLRGGVFRPPSPEHGRPPYEDGGPPY